MAKIDDSVMTSLLNIFSSTGGSSAEGLIVQLLCQFMIILLITRLFVWLAHNFLQQTAVVGEILAGIVLGPSLIGLFFPALTETIFPQQSATIFSAIAQIGLIFLMFEIGLEFEFTSQLQGKPYSVIIISIVSVILPLVIGFGAADWVWLTLPQPRPGKLLFQLFFALSMSITAIPVLGRIFMELGISQTRIATLVIGAAAIDDILGWLLLGVISTLAVAEFNVACFLFKIVAIVIYLLLIFIIIRPWMLRWLSAELIKDNRPAEKTIAYIIIFIFISALITSTLGIFTLIGSFVFGMILHENREFVTLWQTRIAGLVHVFFLPLFFTYTGLRTDIGSLHSAAEWGLCLMICLLAFATKFSGAYVVSRFLGESRRGAAVIGIAMNTRALMGLIVLNIGYDLGVLPKSIFTMLVIMAILSTFMTTPLLRRLMMKKR